jgi:hypothetical protein
MLLIFDFQLIHLTEILIFNKIAKWKRKYLKRFKALFTWSRDKQLPRDKSLTRDTDIFCLYE